MLVSCTSEKPVGKDALRPSDTGSTKNSSEVTLTDTGEIPCSLEIYPSDASRTSTLKMKVMGFSLANAKIEWLVNGRPVPNATPQMFITANTKRGDTVEVRAFIEGKEIISNKVNIKNTPPEIQKVKILPEVVRPGDTLSIEVFTNDLDGDDVTVAYEWTKNGEPAGNGKQIEGALKRGDKISIKLTPFDGESYGPPAVLKREIMNMSPVITEHKQYDFDGKVFTYNVEATDPDGDSLAYSLVSAPRGMTIDQVTGLIQWNVPAGFQGKTSFTVSVSDDHGGKVKQNIVFETRAEPGK